MISEFVDGHRYGTNPPVDLERRRPIELLPEWGSFDFNKPAKDHPGGIHW